MEISTINSYWRVSIHNQIYSTCYYHISEYIPAKNGSWKPSGKQYGYRGKGGALGMNYSQAASEAREENKKLGWEGDTIVLNAKLKYRDYVLA